MENNYEVYLKKQIVYSIKYNDLDNILSKEYEHSFETALDQPNDSVLNISVNGILDKWEEQELVEFKNTGKQMYSTLKILLNDLCRQNKIPSGSYIIIICW